jgi:hypothetical protein
VAADREHREHREHRVAVAKAVALTKGRARGKDSVALTVAATVKVAVPARKVAATVTAAARVVETSVVEAAVVMTVSGNRSPQDWKRDSLLKQQAWNH